MTGKEIVNWKALKSLGIPYSRAHIWRLMRAGEFPRAFKLGSHRNSPPVWYLCEVIEWIERRSTARLTNTQAAPSRSGHSLTVD
jgi:predicted DNA-binding transcriptional regulator AlpA